MRNGSQNKINVLCVPSWYPDPSGAPPQKGIQLRELTKATLLYDNINIIVLRTGQGESHPIGVKRYSSRGIGIIDITPPSPRSRIVRSLGHSLYWHRGLMMALKSWGRPDVIHSQDFSSFHATRSAAALGIPSVISQYWSGFHDRLVDKAMKRRYRRVYAEAEVILTSSPTGETDLRRYGIKGDTRWIPSSINTNRFTSTGLESRNRDLVHFSNLGQDERVEDIIEAFSRIQHLYPDSILHMAGEGGWKHELRRTASEKLKNGSYSFPGFLLADERAAMLRSCCGFVYPSVNNYHSIDLIEAMACGCPCIATEHALQPFEGKISWILPVQPGRIDELTRQMKNLLDGTHTLNTREIRETIHRNHSREYVGKLIHNAHLDAIRRKAKIPAAP